MELSYLLLFLQGAAGTLIFLLPGYLFVRRIGKASPAFVLALSFVLSSLIIVGFQAAVLKLCSPVVARWLAWALLVAAGGAAWFLKKEIVAFGYSIGPDGQRALKFVLLLAAVWIALLPLTPYPSHVGMYLGDAPPYYHVAGKLVRGLGWAPDYFIGDYFSGDLSYVAAQPLLVLTITYFFQIFGENWHSLYVYSILAAALLAYLLSCLCVMRLAQPTRRAVTVLAVGICLIPTYFIYAGLGLMSLPSALACGLFAWAWLDRSLGHRLRWTAVCGASVFLALFRPEAGFLGIVLAAFFTGELLLTSVFGQNSRKKALFLVCVLIALWFCFPMFARKLHPELKELGLYMVQYDVSSRSFIEKYPPGAWNWLISMVHFGKFPEFPVGALNGEIGAEALAHPLAFLELMGSLLFKSLINLLYSFSIPYGLDDAVELLSIPFAVIVTVLSAFAPQGRGLLWAALFYLLALPFLNLYIGVRHLVVVVPIVMALAVQGACARFRLHEWAVKLASLSGVTGTRILVALAVALALVDASWLISIKSDRMNLGYVGIHKDLKKVVQPGDTIAGSYPQLISLLTGVRALGTTFLFDSHEDIIRKFHPSLILFDEARDGPRNYTLLLENKRLEIDGYEPVVHNPFERYIIFRATKK